MVVLSRLEEKRSTADRDLVAFRTKWYTCKQSWNVETLAFTVSLFAGGLS